MCENADINIDDELSKACISWFSVHIASAGAKLFVDAWNNHSIPGNITVILSVPFIYSYMTCAGRRGCVSAHPPNIRMSTKSRKLILLSCLHHMLLYNCMSREEAE